MSDDTVNSTLSEQELETRQEIFRYTDLTHPVMQTLFDIPVSQTSEDD